MPLNDGDSQGPLTDQIESDKSSIPLIRRRLERMGKLVSKMVIFAPKPAHFESKFARFTPLQTLPKWVKCAQSRPFPVKEPTKN